MFPATAARSTSPTQVGVISSTMISKVLILDLPDRIKAHPRILLWISRHPAHLKAKAQFQGQCGLNLDSSVLIYDMQILAYHNQSPESEWRSDRSIETQNVPVWPKRILQHSKKWEGKEERQNQPQLNPQARQCLRQTRDWGLWSTQLRASWKPWLPTRSAHRQLSQNTRILSIGHKKLPMIRLFC